jgi:hypothetical protein
MPRAGRSSSSSSRGGGSSSVVVVVVVVAAAAGAGGVSLPQSFAEPAHALHGRSSLEYERQYIDSIFETTMRCWFHMMNF